MIKYIYTMIENADVYYVNEAYVIMRSTTPGCFEYALKDISNLDEAAIKYHGIIDNYNNLK